jgi:hypothetical protein
VGNIDSEAASGQYSWLGAVCGKYRQIGSAPTGERVWSRVWVTEVAGPLAKKKAGGEPSVGNIDSEAASTQYSWLRAVCGKYRQ